MAAVSLTLGSNEYPLTVVDGTALTLSLSGPAGPAGPTGPTGATGAAGPNTVSTSTTTNLTGYIYGNGTTVGGATEASTGGNGAADAGKLVQFNSTGGVAVSTINNLAITAAANSTLTIAEGIAINAQGEITISSAGAYIITGTTGIPAPPPPTGGIITSSTGYISTTAGGSFSTGTGNLTGPNASGTVALIDPSTGTQTFSGSQSFSSTTRPTSSGTGTPTATSLITRSDLETQLMSDDFVYVVDDFFGGGGPSVGVPAPGPLPWVLTTLIGTSSFRYGANTALNLPCPGGASIQTGTNNRDCGAVSFAATFAGGGVITKDDFNSTTILKWRFYVQSAMGLRIGLGANPVAPTFQSTRFIGLTGWGPATVWTASTAVSVGKYYRPTTPNGRRYYASVAGTTAGTEPVWPTGAASTVTDGGVTWTEDGREGNANFQYCTRDGTALTGTQTDSGIPYAVGWHTFTLRYLGSNNWGMSVDGASEATLNINVATITILMQAQAYTTGQKHLLFDYFKFFQRVR